MRGGFPVGGIREGAPGRPRGSMVSVRTTVRSYLAGCRPTPSEQGVPAAAAPARPTRATQMAARSWSPRSVVTCGAGARLIHRCHQSPPNPQRVWRAELRAHYNHTDLFAQIEFSSYANGEFRGSTSTRWGKYVFVVARRARELDLLLNQESRPISTPVLPPSNDPRPSARPPRLVRLARAPRGTSASLAILAGSLSIAGAAHATLGHDRIGTDAWRGSAVAVAPARAFVSAGEGWTETAAQVAVPRLISPQYQASRRLSQGADRSAPRAGSGIAATEHRVTGPAVLASVRAAARMLLHAPVRQQTRLAVGRPATELPRQDRQAGTEAATRSATHRLARCYRQYYVPDNSQYQFPETIIIPGLTKCTQISSLNSSESTPTASSAARSMSLRIRSQTEGIVAASTVRSVGSSAEFLVRQIASSAPPRVGVARVISPRLDAIPTASRPGSTETSRSTLGDRRRVLQLGLVFGLVYLVFLISWFWGTRGRRRRAGEVRLERGLE